MTNALPSGANPMLPPGTTITGLVETTQQDASMRLVSGQKISFRTGGGASGSIFVPYADLSPSAVATAITAKVATLTAIQGLSNPQL